MRSTLTHNSSCSLVTFSGEPTSQHCPTRPGSTRTEQYNNTVRGRATQRVTSYQDYRPTWNHTIAYYGHQCRAQYQYTGKIHDQNEIAKASPQTLPPYTSDNVRWSRVLLVSSPDHQRERRVHWACKAGLRLVSFARPIRSPAQIASSICTGRLGLESLDGFACQNGMRWRHKTPLYGARISTRRQCGSTARSVEELEETPVSRWAKGYVPLPDTQRRKLRS